VVELEVIIVLMTVNWALDLALELVEMVVLEAMPQQMQMAMVLAVELVDTTIMALLEHQELFTY
jgi:hypothetical protein